LKDTDPSLQRHTLPADSRPVVMAVQRHALCLSLLAGVASSDSTTGLRGAVVAGEACRLAMEGEECYREVEWAMNLGICYHPEWYPGLTPQSPMVAFQSRLHSIGHGNCSRPCEANASANASEPSTSTTEAPSEECGAAMPGEACYGHVEWAMQHGITLHPEWYPNLTQNSTFEEFQAHLHNINHGCCPEPCPSPQPAPSPAKRQCCGILGCRLNSPEYDPATEQCCGEGENIYAPTVCSKDSGCCPSMYSAPPQCFDRGSQQCCGVNLQSEMPVVCSLAVSCPPESNWWKECPAAGAAATVANSSSNELLLP